MPHLCCSPASLPVGAEANIKNKKKTIFLMKNTDLVMSIILESLF